jgi:hypothetical protein
VRAFFAVGDAHTAARLLHGRHVLFSFAYVGSRWLDAPHLAEVTRNAASVRIDSGGFTAWKQGRPIEIGAYVEYLCTAAPPFECAFQLDAVGDPEETARRFDRMLAAAPELGGRIVPIWHEGAPHELLDDYVRRAPLVGLGRIDGRRSEARTLEFYDDAFNRHPGAAFHALGNANPRTLEPYPFASFDATSWQRDAAYSNAARWPFDRCSKETRMRAFIEATETIAHTPPKQVAFRWHRAGAAGAA